MLGLVAMAAIVYIQLASCLTGHTTHLNAACFPKESEAVLHNITVMKLDGCILWHL